MPVPRIEGDLRRITKDWEAGSNPWTKQESYRPDLFDALKEESRKEDNLRKTRNRYLRAIAASQHRRSRPSGQANLRCLGAVALRSTIASFNSLGELLLAAVCPSPDTGARKSGILHIAARIIDGDAFYILAGTLLALDLVIARLLWVSM